MVKKKKLISLCVNGNVLNINPRSNFTVIYWPLLISLVTESSSGEGGVGVEDTNHIHLKML